MFIKTEKTTAWVLSGLFMIFAVFFIFGSHGNKVIKTCREYDSQVDAQKDLAFNPNLDGGHKNGLACDSYSYSQ